MGDYDNYETGPFCRHYGDPVECEHVCVCGHRCPQHYSGDGEECMEDGCGCAGYAEQCDHINRHRYGEGPWVCSDCNKTLFGEVES